MQKKPMTKIQYSFITKALMKLGIEKNVPQHNEGYIRQVNIQYHTKWGKIASISSEVRNKTRKKK
jgi:hypothetical protein